MRAFRFCSPLLAIFLLTALTATANTCDSFASFTCSKSTPDLVHLVGTGATGQSVGIVLGNTFNVTFMGNKSFFGDDLVILAAAPNGLTGSVNGVSFSSLSSFPEGGAMGAIEDTHGRVRESCSRHLPLDTRTWAPSGAALFRSAPAAWVPEPFSTRKSSMLRLARSFTSHRTRKQGYWREAQRLHPSLLL
jgi:hypothetical protein